ncbi:hypothetical protein EI94DRAFT_666502 [Lactarius quietus]|nr:hypothetical protein EI94DRAFT_666502 [Lactarius quietus]
MRRMAKKTEDVQKQLDLLDDVLSLSHARTQYRLDDAHTPRLAIAITPDDTGQPPPPPLEPTIHDVRIPLLGSITKPHPFLPESLRQTPERNPHDPTIRHSPDYPRQIFACIYRVSDSAKSWSAEVESLLETISQLEAKNAREAESRERSERCLREELAAIKDELVVTQTELSSTVEGLGMTQEELAATKERLCMTQENLSNANHDLDREREILQKTRTQAKDVTHELETCKASFKHLQDARRTGIVRFCEVVELLCQRSADLDSLRAEAKVSKSKHSEAVSLSAVLRKRVEILEAEVNSLRLNQ